MFSANNVENGIVLKQFYWKLDSLYNFLDSEEFGVYTIEEDCIIS